jgi:hypothetical protein
MYIGLIGEIFTAFTLSENNKQDSFFVTFKLLLCLQALDRTQTTIKLDTKDVACWGGAF